MQVSVQGFEYLRETGDVMSHVYCTINLKYGNLPFEWTVKRSFAEILNMHSRIQLLVFGKKKGPLPALPNLFFPRSRGTFPSTLN